MAERAEGTERARPSRHWLVLVVFGAVILGATGFYWESLPSCMHGVGPCSAVTSFTQVNFANSGLAPVLPFHNHWVGVYWLASIPVGFLLVLWFVRDGRRTFPLVAAGSVAMALLAVIVVFSSVVGWPLLVLPGDLTSRGLAALLVIAVAMGVWAVAERDLLLGLVVCMFFVVALVSCTYDLSNVASFGSSPSAAELPNVVIPGLYLLLGGVGLAVLERIGSRPNAAGDHRNEAR